MTPRKDVLQALKAKPGTAADLARRTFLPQRTVLVLLRDLDDKGEAHVNSGGRRSGVWEYGPGPDAQDDDGEDEARAAARDIERGRSWLQTWVPSRDPLTAAFFGPPAKE